MSTTTADLARIAVELATHEATIERGLKTFVQVGGALVDIRDARLYRNDYSTFESYCQQRWNFNRKRVYDLMSASQTVKSLSPMGDTPIPLPTSERQARELSGLEPEVAAEVMRNANDSGKVTAQTIREARKVIAPKPVAKITESTKTETYVDTDTGEVVTPPLEPSQAITDLLAIRKGQAEGTIRTNGQRVTDVNSNSIGVIDIAPDFFSNSKESLNWRSRSRPTVCAARSCSLRTG